LYHSSQLKEALAWQKRNTVSENEAAFLRASAVRYTRQAVAGLVLGIIGLIAWYLPLFGTPIGIIGVVMSVMGRRSASRRTMATVGLVLCIISLVLSWLSSAYGAYTNGYNAGLRAH